MFVQEEGVIMTQFATPYQRKGGTVRRGSISPVFSTDDMGGTS